MAFTTFGYPRLSHDDAYTLADSLRTLSRAGQGMRLTPASVAEARDNALRYIVCLVPMHNAYGVTAGHVDVVDHADTRRDAIATLRTALSDHVDAWTETPFSRAYVARLRGDALRVLPCEPVGNIAYAVRIARSDDAPTYSSVDVYGTSPEYLLFALPNPLYPERHYHVHDFINGCLSDNESDTYATVEDARQELRYLVDGYPAEYWRQVGSVASGRVQMVHREYGSVRTLTIEPCEEYICSPQNVDMDATPLRF